MSTQRREIAVQALKELWQELKFEGNPLIFISPMQKRIQLEHHPMVHVARSALLSKAVGRRFRSIFSIMKAMTHTHFQTYPMGARMSGWHF